MSISHTGGGETHIMEDGHRSGIERIPVELNTPLVVIYTLQVTPKVARVEYWPYTSVLVYRPGVLASGINSGNSVSYANEAGTWTWSAEGDYVWHWVATTPDYAVTFLERVEQPVADQEAATAPAPAPTPTPTGTSVSWWQVVIGITATAGVVIIGLGTYLAIRRRRGTLRST